jgi:hypothetical protein
MIPEMLVKVGDRLCGRDPLSVSSRESTVLGGRDTFGVCELTCLTVEADIESWVMSKGPSSINCLRFFRRPSGSEYKGEIVSSLYPWIEKEARSNSRSTSSGRASELQKLAGLSPSESSPVKGTLGSFELSVSCGKSLEAFIC